MLDILLGGCYIINVKCILHYAQERQTPVACAKGGDYLNNKIKELRKEKGLTQDDLAKGLKVTRQTIISLESGKYTASLPLAHKIAVYFGQRIEDVFIFEEEE